MSQAEAAALLGIAVPTVKSRWLKARLRVQQALGGSPFDDPARPTDVNPAPPEGTETSR
jgi:hypothetical protein